MAVMRTTPIFNVFMKFDLISRVLEVKKHSGFGMDVSGAIF